MEEEDEKGIGERRERGIGEAREWVGLVRSGGPAASFSVRRPFASRYWQNIEWSSGEAVPCL